MDPESEEGEGYLSSEPRPFAIHNLGSLATRPGVFHAHHLSRVCTTSQTSMLIGIYSSLLTWEKHSFGSNIHSSCKHLLDSYVSLTVGCLEVAEINISYPEQRRNMLEGCDITHEMAEQSKGLALEVIWVRTSQRRQAARTIEKSLLR